MNLIKAVLDLLNGKKLNTGTVMVIAVFVLKQLGLDDNTATQTATNIMLGVGGVLTLWGYIHRMIKSAQAKKVADASEQNAIRG
jgi:hypothetical protein